MKRKYFQPNDQQKLLEEQCIENGISYSSIVTLLEIEKAKRLFKRNSLMQHNIDIEIEKALNNED